jgi:cytoskeletal protein CcmA (bactofilin family)
MLFKKRASSVNRIDKSDLHPTSVISKNLEITGNLVSEGDVHISGTIDGNITCGNLTVIESASVNGQINATQVFIHGAVQGSILAKNIALRRTARVIGDVTYKTLEVESGAFLEGLCKRSLPQTAAETDTKQAIDKPSIEGRNLSQKNQLPQHRRGPLRKNGTPDTSAAVEYAKTAKEKYLHTPK